MGVETLTIWVLPTWWSGDSATNEVETCALAARPLKRQACTSRRWPLRTKPSASSLPRKADEAATSRLDPAEKTATSQSPRLVSRARTRPVALDLARTKSVCRLEPTNFF